MLVKHCLDEMVPLVIEGLRDGPPGGEPPIIEAERSHWFRSLPVADQKQVQETVEYSLDLCLFHLLNILDGTSPIQLLEQTSDFAVYLQTYADGDDNYDNPTATVRVNPVVPDYENDGEQLHDIFSKLRGESSR